MIRHKFHRALNHAPRWPFVMDKDSVQSQGVNWWVPLISPQSFGKDMAGSLMPGDFHKRNYENGAEVVGSMAARNRNTTSNENRIGNYDTGTLTAPFTLFGRSVVEDTNAWAAFMKAENAGGSRLVLGMDDAQHMKWSDFSGVSSADDGPNIVLNEFALHAVVVRNATDASLYQITRSQGFERNDFSRTIGTTGNTVWQIGEDDASGNRVWRGVMFDVGTAEHAIADSVLFDMWAGRWNMYYELGKKTFYTVPAGAPPAITAVAAMATGL